MELPNTNQRVALNTSEKVNRNIQAGICGSIEFYRENPTLIPHRLEELDKEWDIERTLETNASILVVTGSLLGFLSSKKFFAVPLVVGSFLLQHALQGWCPPLPVLRRLGHRTTDEIQKEKSALKNILRNHKHSH